MFDKCDKVIEMNTKNFNREGAYIPKNMSFDRIINNIYNDNGTYYYAKEIDLLDGEDLIIHELIGSYLAKLIGLDEVDYKIGRLGDKIYMLSELFFDRDFTYSYVGKCRFNANLKNLKKAYLVDKIPQEYPNLRDSILKLVLLDLKMGQYDRYNPSNITIKKALITDYKDLAPIYDFGFAYPFTFGFNLDDFEIYYNAFIKIRKNEESLNLLIDKYPHIQDTIHTLACANMRLILDIIRFENGIKIDNDIKQHIIKQDDKNSKLLKRFK